MNDLASYILGESTEALVLGSMEENRLTAVAMCTQARRSVYIYSTDLDSHIYNNAEFYDAIRTVAIADHRRSEVRILIADSRQIVLYGHRLVELSRQLSSFVNIRKLTRSARAMTSAFLIADGCGLIYRPEPARYEAHACFNAPRRCREMITLFNEQWERAEPDPELKRLHI